jgi:hypothetical protein
MKRYLLTLLLILPIITYSQDTIYKNDGTEIQAKVVEITPDAIKYKRFSNLDGPIYNIAIADIFMIVYENGEREVFKKKEAPVAEPTPPPVQQQPPREVPVQQPAQPETPVTTQTQTPTMTLSEGYKHTGLYAGFLGGVLMPQSMTFEEEAKGLTDIKVELDKDLDSKFNFVAHAAWQTDNLAFIIGGSVNSVSIRDRDLFSMTYWGAGINYYFTLEQFSPYTFFRAALGFGKFDENLSENSNLETDFTLTGYNLNFGVGSKVYIDQSWGLLIEAGYFISSQSVDDKIKDNRGNKYDYTFSNDLNAISIVAGFFFYP